MLPIPPTKSGVPRSLKLHWNSHHTKTHPLKTEVLPPGTGWGCCRNTARTALRIGCTQSGVRYLDPGRGHVVTVPWAIRIGSPSQGPWWKQWKGEINPVFSQKVCVFRNSHAIEGSGYFGWGKSTHVFLFWKVCFFIIGEFFRGFYHGKWLLNHHFVRICFLLFPSILSKSKFNL